MRRLALRLTLSADGPTLLPALAAAGYVKQQPTRPPRRAASENGWVGGWVGRPLVRVFQREGIEEALWLRKFSAPVVATGGHFSK